MTELGTNPKDLIGITKLRLDLIPSAATRPEAVVMALGAKKYGEWNWRANKVKASIYVAAARRHLMDWFDGQDIDPESGVSHLAHVRACMGILLDAEATGNLVDDRMKTNLENRRPRDPARKPAPETVPDWHESVEEIRSESSDNAMAEIQPSGNTGELASDPIYTWGGGKWTIIGGTVFCWNKLQSEWQESTMLPEQLQADGQLLSNPE